MFRKAMSVLGVAALTVALWVSPAQAALSDCTAYSNVVCLWQNGAAGGGIWRQTTAQVPTVGCRPLTEAGWNNTVTTVRLQSSLGYVLRLYDTSNCTGTYVEAFQNLTYDFTGNPWNNRISSVRLRAA